MPLVIRLVEKSRHTWHCPTVFCDWCQEPIVPASIGNYHWRVALDGTLPDGGQLYFTHKQCCHPFETANVQDGVVWYAEELQLLPLFLMRTLQTTEKDAQNILRMYASAFG